MRNTLPAETNIMDEPTSHYWVEIKDLPENWQSLRNHQAETLAEVWQSQAKDMQRSHAYHNFLIKLRRQWAIETGILERLYSLSEGATKTLIEQGLDATFISSGDSDRPAGEVVAVIRDQYNAIEGLYAFISGSRPLGKSYIRELHMVLTANQRHYEAVDTLGQQVVRELPRGVWKALRNNVEGPGGFVFEFCPPEHVEAEMDRLLEMHQRHEKEAVPPEIEAAWLHHRFTLIHPFTDGNGRVARCLATLVLLKHNWFPLVVTRHERAEYITALRSADAGDLSPLVNLFSTLQTRAIRQAMSMSEEISSKASAVQTILSAVKSQLAVQRAGQMAEKRRVRQLGDALRKLAKDKLDDRAKQIAIAIGVEGEGFSAFTTEAGPGSTEAGYHSYQIVQCAKALGYYANRQVFQAWALLAIVTSQRVEILFSFHGIGGNSDGLLVCSAMAYSKQSTEDGHTQIGEVLPLMDEPFYFTYQQDPKEVIDRFGKWVDNAILNGLDYWRKSLGA